jgi:adenosylmethionine-8-amino-7-oxononanoate aminotransferase
MGGTIDGQQGDHVLIAPPYVVETAHLHELVDKLAVSLVQVL